MQMPTPYDDQAVQVLEEAERLKLNCQHEESIALLENLLSDDPANVAALEELADNELSLERYDRAVAAAKQAVVLDHKSYMGHYILGVAASLRGEWQKAYEELHLANELRSNNAEILRCLGWVLFSMEKRVQGIATLERAVNLDPHNTLSLCDLGVCYLQARNYKKSLSLFEFVLDLDPMNDRARDCVDTIERMQKIERR
jgi:tetratricopeptide (TPR) repeat protein